jgi:hypothetical protein
MAILFLIAGIFFLFLLNIAFDRPPQYPYPPDDFYHPAPYRYYRDDVYPPARRSLFSQRLMALLNTFLFVLLLAGALLFAKYYEQ